jgi:hypothetical protein
MYMRGLVIPVKMRCERQWFLLKIVIHIHQSNILWKDFGNLRFYLSSMNILSSVAYSLLTMSLMSTEITLLYCMPNYLVSGVTFH